MQSRISLHSIQTKYGHGHTRTTCLYSDNDFAVCECLMKTISLCIRTETQYHTLLPNREKNKENCAKGTGHLYIRFIRICEMWAIVLCTSAPRLTCSHPRPCPRPTSINAIAWENTWYRSARPYTNRWLRQRHRATMCAPVVCVSSPCPLLCCAVLCMYVCDDKDIMFFF